MMATIRDVWFAVLAILVVVMVTWSSGQQCTPASNSQGTILPNTNLPTQGVRLYFQEASKPIPNFLMFRASQLEPTGFQNIGPTRALWCQSANTDSNNGTWFQPPGSRVVTSEDIDSPTDEPYQIVTCPGQVGLVRDIGLAGTDHIGLVQCVIRDEMNTTHTLTAGVYTGVIYDNYTVPIVDSNMQFTLTSSRDADSPVFTLTFNSSNGPPTMVECSRNGIALNTSLYTVSREVLRTQYVQNGDVDSVNASEPDMPDVTRVTVTVRERETGEYRCNVTVVGRNDSIPWQVIILGTGSSTLMITMSGTPTNVTADRRAPNEVTVMWDAPSPVPDGYEVFYQADGGDALSGGITTSTQLILTGLSVLQELSCFVIAFSSNAIPSARSNIATVQSAVKVSLDSMGSPILAGTSRSLVCLVPETISIIIWMKNGSPVNTDDSRLTVSRTQSNSTLSFNPLHTSDGGRYQCIGTAVGNGTVINITEDIDFNVTTLPPPTVMTTSSGTMSPGSSLTLTCIVGVVEGLILQPAIEWTKQAVGVGGDTALNSISVGAMRTNNTVTLSFNPINTSDAGQYTCTATVNVSAINITVTNNSMVDIRLQIPSPIVSLILSSVDKTVSANSSALQSYLAGSTLTLTCDIYIPLTVNTPFDVTMEWTGDNDNEDFMKSRMGSGHEDFMKSGMGSGHEDFMKSAMARVNISKTIEISPNHYQSKLLFSTLSSSMDSGNYVCHSSIDSKNSLLYVRDSAMVNENATLSVQDPTITNETVTPTMVAVLESTCPDSDPHNNFTLVCSARKPAVVIPQLTVQWLHNGSMRASDVSVSDNGTYVVNTLNVSEVDVSDAGVYMCVASIVIPDSPTVFKTMFSVIGFKAMSAPNTPTAAVYTINPTNATIRITVPSIAYTRETYYILYNGQERDTNLAQSDTVSGTADITATNSSYSITLSNLEEDTTYNYTVTASNCIGNTTTATMSFRTLFNLPSLSVSTDSMGSPGISRSLLCSMDSNSLPVTFTAWLKNGNPVNTSDSRVSISATHTNSTLIISSLHTSDGGQYQCIRTVVGNGTAINITDKIDLNISIPTPIVVLTLSSVDSVISANSSTSQSYLAGSTLTISCDIYIPLTVNTPFDVTMQWSKDGDDDNFDMSKMSSGNSSTCISITDVTETSTNRYQTQLVFRTLSSSMDSGVYDCSIVTAHYCT